jgi:hypothetical protein
MSATFPVQIGLKQGDALLPLLFNFAFECHQESPKIQVDLELNETHQLLVYAVILIRWTII